MDGAAASYYFKPEDKKLSSSIARIWLIYLGGGGSCYDEASCQRLAEFERDDVDFDRDAESIKLGGIFSNDGRNTLSSRTKVYVPMCSGDSWLGNAKLWNKWFFRGASIYRSVVRHLVEVQGLGTHEAGE